MVAGPTHRYIGASAACWALYSNFHNGGEPPVAGGPLNGLLVDGYAAQHPGVPSAQAIQSVAVHLLVLYAVLEKGQPPDKALWIRLQAVSEQRQPKYGRYHWLTPPDFTGSLTIADIIAPSTPQARAAQIEPYVREVWSRWGAGHHATIAAWYTQFVEAG